MAHTSRCNFVVRSPRFRAIRGVYARTVAKTSYHAQSGRGICSTGLSNLKLGNQPSTTHHSTTLKLAVAMWDTQTQSQLQEFLVQHLRSLTDYGDFYANINYDHLCDLVKCEDIDYINMKIDEFATSRLFPSGKFDTNALKSYHSLTNSCAEEINSLQLKPFVLEHQTESTDADELRVHSSNSKHHSNTTSPVGPTNRDTNMDGSSSLSIPKTRTCHRHRRFSLDLIHNRTRNRSQLSCPAPIDVTMVNVNVQPTKIGLMAKPEVMSKKFLLKYGKRDQSSVKQQAEPQPKKTTNRRNSMLMQSLPTYVLDQLKQPEHTRAENNENMIKQLSEAVQRLTMMLPPPEEVHKNSAHKPTVKSTQQTRTNNVLKPNLVEEEDANKHHNTTRFQNVLSNSQQLYTHSAEISLDKTERVFDSPNTLSDRAETIQEDITEDEYVLPNLVTRYYQIDDEDSQEREEFLRALDADDDTELLNGNDSIDEINNDNDGDEEYLF